MAEAKWRVAFFFCVVFMTNNVKSSQEVISNMSASFRDVKDACQAELKLGDEIMQEIYNFWKEDYALVKRDLGCMILCMSGKLNIIDENNMMHHGNAHEFAKKHGADDEVAKQVVTIIHDCEKPHTAIEDQCSRILEVAKCFRTKMHELKWAPSMEVVMEEIMTDV